MIEMMTTDGVWHTIHGVPVTAFNFQRDLNLVRNENEDTTYLIGDGGVSPLWVEIVEKKVFPWRETIFFDNTAITWDNTDITFGGPAGTGAGFLDYLAWLEDILSRVAKVRFSQGPNDTQIKVTFGYLTYEPIDNQLVYEFRIRLAPAVTSFPLRNGGVIYWGETTVLLGDTTITLGGNSV